MGTNVSTWCGHRIASKLFNLRRSASKTKTFTTLIRGPLYVDDCDPVRRTVSDIQNLMIKVNVSSNALGLQISLDKTPWWCIKQCHPKPEIFLHNLKLKIVDKCSYLGSALNLPFFIKWWDHNFHPKTYKDSGIVGFGKIEILVLRFWFSTAYVLSLFLWSLGDISKTYQEPRFHQ